MKIMMYCQHVLGIGHFFRSMEIAGAMDRHEVLFVEGGDPLPGFVPPAHVKRLALPSMMMDPEFKALDARGDDLEAVKARRAELLMESFSRFAPDVLITELFPFGRRQFRFELMPILKKIRAERLPTKVVCSLRDILVEKPNQATYEENVLAILNDYFDLLLIHSDPKLIPLDESFTRVGDIRVPVEYTGFVVRKPHEPPEERDGKVIVLSSGGGRVGVDLLASAIMATTSMRDEDLDIRVFLGPFMEEEDRAYLADCAAGDPRVSLLPFSLDFLSELSRADLSVSMAGYNTCMDILASGIKALVYPFPQNQEQTLRAMRLESAGYLQMIHSLAVESLYVSMHTTLDTFRMPPHMELDLSGARNTALVIEKRFGGS
ncbi:MAG: glycosyltransferase family protein [Acidobacteriota bacterium]